MLRFDCSLSLSDQVFMLFRLSFLVILVFLCSCTHRNTTNTTTNSQANTKPTERAFETIEPEKFQAEIVSFAQGFEDSARKIFIAKDGLNRLVKFSDGKAQLQKDGKTYLINYNKKIFAEAGSKQDFFAERSPFQFLTAELLNRKYEAKIEKLGTENGITKFSVKVDNSPKSEVVIFYDEVNKIITRREYYSISDKKELAFVIEMQNLRFDTDKFNFELPANFKKVSIADFDRQSKSAEIK